MLRLLAPLALFSLGLAAEQPAQQKQEDAGSVQVPLATVEQPQQQFFSSDSQQLQYPFPYFQYQGQQQQSQQFYYTQQPQQLQQSPQQQFFYPYQLQQPLQPVQPAFQMSPKLVIPTGLLAKHINASSDEPSVFALSYDPETGVKVTTINGKKVFAYKQRFPGAPKENIEIVGGGEAVVTTDDAPVVVPAVPAVTVAGATVPGASAVVATTSENAAGEKTKNVWFDDKDDPMVKIENDATLVSSSLAPSTVVPTTTVAPSGVVAVSPVVDAVSTTPLPIVSSPAIPLVASTAVPVLSSTPVVSTTPSAPGQAFFAAQNPFYMANVAAFSAKFPQYFPTPFAPKPLGPFAVPSSTLAPSVGTGAVQVTPMPHLVAGSGLSQVHPSFQQAAVSTTPFPQPAFSGPLRLAPQPLPQQYFQSTPQSLPAQYLQSSTPMPVLQQSQQQFLPAPPQPVAQPQYYQQPQGQQFLQSTPQPVAQPPQYFQQPQTQQPQYVQSTHQQPEYQQQAPHYAQPARPHYVQQEEHSQYQQPPRVYPAQPAAPRQYVAPPPPPAYHEHAHRPAPPQDFTSEETRPADENVRNEGRVATSTAPPGMRPDSRYEEQPSHSTGYESTTPEPAYERPSPPPRPRYQPAPSRYVQKPSSYASRTAPARHSFYPSRPAPAYNRPAAYRQPIRTYASRGGYASTQNRRVNYFKAGTQSRVQQQSSYRNAYSAPRVEPAAAKSYGGSSSIPDYVPSPSYRQHGYSQSQYTTPPTTTTEDTPVVDRYYARVNNEDQSKVKYSESPIETMEFASTPYPTGAKKDVKITFINRQRKA